MFYYYVFSSQVQIDYIKNYAIQTGVPHTNLSILKKTPVPLPPLSVQKKIASILGAFDDKIELNRQMNMTLEGMAQALFKSWFIDFDPVHQNISNNTPNNSRNGAQRNDGSNDDQPAKNRHYGEYASIPAAVLKLFPKEFEDSKLGLIPKEWKVEKIGNLLELAYGKSLTAKDRKLGSVPVYGSGGVTGTHSEALVSGPGVIIGRKGTVGSVYWEDGDFFPIDTVFYVKISSSTMPLHWAYQQLRLVDIEKLGADSAVPGVNRNAILDKEWVRPIDELLFEYWRVVKDGKILANS